MYEIIGIERIDYTNKSGNRVQGYSVAFTFDYEDGVGRGKGCDNVFVSDAVFAGSGIDVGVPAMPIYNKRGRCTGFVESTA